MKKVLTLIAGAAVTLFAGSAMSADKTIDIDGSSFIVYGADNVLYGVAPKDGVQLQIADVTVDSARNVKCRVQIDINVDRLASGQAGEKRYNARQTIQCPASYIATPSKVDVRFLDGSPMVVFANGQWVNNQNHATTQGLITMVSKAYFGRWSPLNCGGALYKAVYSENGLLHYNGQAVGDEIYCWG